MLARRKRPWLDVLPKKKGRRRLQMTRCRHRHRSEHTMEKQATPKGAWKITFLLFLYMLVNFADKIVVGLAGVPIMTELKLEPEQFGFLGSSFFLLFSISAIVVGFIVNRVDTRWVLLALAAVWALTQFPM